MNQVLLSVSGEIPDNLEEKIARGERPLADYLAMARAFGADLIDYKKARQLGGWLGRWIEKLAGREVMLAWACFLLRGRYRTIFTDGEQIGLPLAFLFKFLLAFKHPRHLMIVHILSVKKKTLLIDLFRLHTHIDLFFVYASWQKRFIETRWKLPAQRVIFTPFMVDTAFFNPAQVEPAARLAGELPQICAVGLEFRDYPTLVEAVRGMNVRVVIAAASPWSKRANELEDRPIPENVTVKRFSQYELRQVYADSQLMVMPLYDVEFQAGVTAILEAMAMGKPVICTRTTGQTDIITDGENGVYAPPQDAPALRGAIERLLADPDLCRELGQRGRARVLAEMSLDRYTARLRQYV